MAVSKDKKFVIRSAYNHGSDTNACASGSRTLPRFRRRFNAGKAELVPDGTEDIYAEIQLNAKGNLVGDLIRRSKNGDTEALGIDSNSFADLTGAPTSLLDAELKLVSAREQFDALPIDIKQKYGSLSAFLSAIDDGSFVKGIQAAEQARLKAEQDAAAVAASAPVFTDAQMKQIKEMINK